MKDERDSKGDIIRLSPKLAQAIGLNESIVVMQLQYLVHISGHERDGKQWTYQTLAVMRKDYFPFLSVATLSRILHGLQKLGLIELGNYNKAKFDRTQWISVNLSECLKLPGFYIFQNDKSSTAERKKQSRKMRNRIVQDETTIPETTTEITTENTKTIEASPSGSPPPRRNKPESKPKPERDILLDHPAVIAYREILHWTLNAAQRQEASVAVKESVVWRKTLREWKLNNKNPAHFAYVLNQYERELEYERSNGGGRNGQGNGEAGRHSSGNSNRGTNAKKGIANPGRGSGIAKPEPAIGQPAGVQKVPEAENGVSGGAGQGKGEAVPVPPKGNQPEGVGGDSLSSVRQAEIIPFASASGYSSESGFRRSYG